MTPHWCPKIRLFLTNRKNSTFVPRLLAINPHEQKGDHAKYAIDPINQAATACKRILEVAPEKFEDIKKCLYSQYHCKLFLKYQLIIKCLSQLKKVFILTQ